MTHYFLLSACVNNLFCGLSTYLWPSKTYQRRNLVGLSWDTFKGWNFFIGHCNPISCSNLNTSCAIFLWWHQIKRFLAKIKLPKTISIFYQNKQNTCTKAYFSHCENGKNFAVVLYAKIPHRAWGNSRCVSVCLTDCSKSCNNFWPSGWIWSQFAHHTTNFIFNLGWNQQNQISDVTILAFLMVNSSYEFPIGLPRP